ncbi:MAG TPA: hypothetical protein VM841_08770 [Actinomycetota bacterium]|nr:hypothetical protein [Actinomycetota bacterium]
MIAASAVLVVVAFVTLIIGIFQTGLELIWVSIASSVLAAIFLLLGVVKGRPPRVATAGAPYGEPAWGEAQSGAPTITEAPPAATEAPPAIILPDEEEDLVADEAEEEVLPPRRTTAAAGSASRTPAKKTAAKKTAAKKTAARTPAAQQQVVVIPDRDKFHKTTCRYAKGAGTMKLTKSEARREGYKACGVCKP